MYETTPSELNTIIAFLALIVSIVSIVFTAIQVNIQKTHYKNLVKPISKIGLGDYENHIFLKISNNGLGPLIVKKITVKNKYLTTESSFIDILPKEFAKSTHWENYTTKYEGRVLRQGQYLELISWKQSIAEEYHSPKKVKEQRDALRSCLKDVSIDIKYTDIYGKEEFSEYLSLNEWFSRYDD